MDRYQDETGRCDGIGGNDDMMARTGREARVPVIAVRDELARAVTDAARDAGAVTMRADAEQLGERWGSAAVVVLDEPAAAALMTRFGFFAPRDGRPTVLLYSGRLVDMAPEDAAALWEAADVLEATHVLPHGDWLDEPAAAAWAALLGATLAAGSVPLQADEYDHGAGHDDQDQADRRGGAR